MLPPALGERSIPHVGYRTGVRGTRRSRPFGLCPRAKVEGGSPNTTRGNLGVLTKTGKIIPQGVLVKIAKVRSLVVRDCRDRVPPDQALGTTTNLPTDNVVRRVVRLEHGVVGFYE